MTKAIKKRLRKTLISFGVLSCFFALGLSIGLSSWDKNLYVQWIPSQGRGLAEAHGEKEILNFSYENLRQEAESTLFSKTQIIRNEDFINFYLGNFLIPDSKTEKYQFICQSFPLVEFTFSALGLSLNGDQGLMVIQSSCQMEDKDFIGPFWLPHQHILSHSSQTTFEFPEKEVFIRFYNAGLKFTPSWLLTSVRFFDDAQLDREFLVHFQPGEDKPYFQLSLKDINN